MWSQSFGITSRILSRIGTLISHPNPFAISIALSIAWLLYTATCVSWFSGVNESIATITHQFVRTILRYFLSFELKANGIFFWVRCVVLWRSASFFYVLWWRWWTEWLIANSQRIRTLSKKRKRVACPLVFKMRYVVLSIYSKYDMYENTASGPTSLFLFSTTSILLLF